MAGRVVDDQEYLAALVATDELSQEFEEGLAVEHRRELEREFRAIEGDRTEHMRGSCAGHRCRHAAAHRRVTTCDAGSRPARSSPRPRRQLRRGSERPFFERGESLLEPDLLRFPVGAGEALARTLHGESELVQQPRQQSHSQPVSTLLLVSSSRSREPSNLE